MKYAMLLLAIFLTGSIWANDASPPLIQVSGEATVSTDPTMASMQLGAAAVADDASHAQAQVNEIVTRVIAAVEEQGIRSHMIQTSGLSLSPIYEQQDRRDAQNQQPRIIGYRASNVVTVRTHDLAKIGAIIDGSIEAGANQVMNLSFGLRHEQMHREEALKQAVAHAQQKAQTLAEALNLKLGPVHQVTESVGMQPLRGAQPMMMRAEAVGTPVMGGQVEVTASVSVSYRIVQE